MVFRGLVAVFTRNIFVWKKSGLERLQWGTAFLLLLYHLTSSRNYVFHIICAYNDNFPTRTLQGWLMLWWNIKPQKSCWVLFIKWTHIATVQHTWLLSFKFKLCANIYTNAVGSTMHSNKINSMKVTLLAAHLAIRWMQSSLDATSMDMANPHILSRGSDVQIVD